MKIAWMSNAPWANTGYGQQTAQVLPRLRDAGHDVACIANYGLAGGLLEWEGFRVYPQGKSDYSNDIIPAHALHWFDSEPGLLITLYDVWALGSAARAYSELNVASWCPVDHMPAPPLVKQFFEDTGATPIAMSGFGEVQLGKVGLDPLYVPHGIDTKVFAPKPKAEAKARFGIDPDRFLVGMVSTNNSNRPCRKAYPEAFAAFAMFANAHPDVLMYVHAEKKSRGIGIDLDLLAMGRAVQPDNLRFVDEYRYMTGAISPQEMAWMYSAFDVLLFPSMGEGFGIPAIEAQACGTPVIVSNCTAQTELVAPGAGYLVECQPYWDSAQNADFSVPFIEEIYDVLTHAYDNRHRMESLGEQCREFALRYDADTVFAEHWLPALKALESELPSTEPIAL